MPRPKSNRVARETGRIKGRKLTPSEKIRKSQQRRIGVFMPEPSLHGVTFAGLNLIRSLRAMGHSVLACCPDGPLGAMVADSVEEFLPPPTGWMSGRRFRDELADFDPQILHCVSPHLGHRGFDSASRLNVASIASVYGVKPEELPDAGDHRHNAFLATDHMVRERLMNDSRVDRDRIAMIPPSIFQQVYPPKHSSRHRLVVGWVGQMRHDLGYPAFIEAAIRVHAKRSGAMFTLVGDGPDAADVREAITERGVQKRVVFVQRMHDYHGVWDPLDVVVVDARQPAASVLVLEAMARGLPVIATQGGAVFDVIRDGVDGLLVARDDPSALSELILMLMQNDDERARMSKEAIKRVEEDFAPKASQQQLNMVYDALLEGAPMPTAAEMRKEVAQT